MAQLGNFTRAAEELHLAQPSLSRQISTLEQSLGATGLSLVNVEGHPYVPGMAASALNLSDFTPDASLIVDQMVEPIVMGLDGLRRQGTVVLRNIKK